MHNKRKICVVTGTRAEYGLLSGLMKKIKASHDLELQLIVTGAHLSSEFGLTYRQIEDDGFLIDKKVEMLLSSDTPVGISKSMGVSMIGFADAYRELEPDLLVVLGDRYEIFCAVSAALIACIPVAHLHGGEVTRGAFDESLRHAITKMSHLHFTSTEQYRGRVIQLGESPDSVFNVGAIGIDNIKTIDLLSRDELEASMSFPLAKRNLLVTFHPVTLEKGMAEQQFNNLLKALDELDNTHLVFTMANADTGGRIINKMIDDFVQKNPEKSKAFDSLGLLRYLSAMQYVDAVIGNSSSGLLEAPSFKVATINIGSRQQGRIKADSVIDCDADYESIRDALLQSCDETFQRKLQSVDNPYGNGGTADKIIDIIRKHSLDGLIKKEFHDLN